MAKKKSENKNYLQLKYLQIEREKARLVLDKSVILYFIFMLVGIYGFINQFFDKSILTLLIILGMLILILGTIPYLIILTREEKKIKGLLE